MSEHVGRPQGGLRSDAGRAAYWRMQWESAIGALADLIAEHTETVEECAALRAERDLLRDYDPVPGLVARGVMSSDHDPDSCEADCCEPTQSTQTGPSGAIRLEWIEAGTEALGGLLAEGDRFNIVLDTRPMLARAVLAAVLPMVREQIAADIEALGSVPSSYDGIPVIPDPATLAGAARIARGGVS